MSVMDKLLAALKALTEHHSASPNRDFDALLSGLKTALTCYEPRYAYRARMSWDTSMGDHGWFGVETDENAALLADKGHQVEAHLAGDWMTYPIEVPA
jgi:hypothetical protein